jgi:hypothetical protein
MVSNASSQQEAGIKPCLALYFSSEDGGIMFLKNIGEQLPDHTALRPRKEFSSAFYISSIIFER